MRPSAFILCAVAVLLALTWTSGPATAHHAVQAQFDQNKLATLTGVMTRVMWINPHVRWFMDVEDENGNVTSWNISGAGPARFGVSGSAVAMCSQPARPTRQPLPRLVTARTSDISSRSSCPTAGRSISGINTRQNPLARAGRYCHGVTNRKTEPTQSTIQGESANEGACASIQPGGDGCSLRRDSPDGPSMGQDQPGQGNPASGPTP